MYTIEEDGIYQINAKQNMSFEGIFGKMA